MRRKEYAVSIGLAEPGRGRMSLKAHAAIAKAEAEGMTFSDTPKHSVKVVDGQEVKVIEHTDYYAATPEPIHRNRNWKVDANGKSYSVSERNVCMNCKFSLPWHVCGSPRIVSAFGIKEVYFA